MNIKELGYYLYMDSEENKESKEVNNQINPFLVSDLSTKWDIKSMDKEKPIIYPL